MAKVHSLSEELSDSQFWTRPYPYGNSFGHLTLHIIGNLNHFIGNQIAGTGYVRDREREFADEGQATKQELLAKLDDAVNLVNATVAAQQLEDWSKPYQGPHTPDFVKTRFDIFLRCATHFHHHLGQMIYLQKELLKNR